MMKTFFRSQQWLKISRTRRQTDRQMDEQTDRQTGGYAEKMTCK